MFKAKSFAIASMILATGLTLELGAQALAGLASNAIAERLRKDPLMMPYYTGHIMPTPQKVEYRDEFILMDNVAIIVGKDVENPGPLAGVMIDRIARYGGQAEIVAAPGAKHSAVISLGDTDIAKQVKDLPATPEKEQGYVLHSTTAASSPNRN